MAYGTAPRKVGGVWVTRSGRRLSNAGQSYWNKLHAQGRTDGNGHMVQHATATQSSAPVKKPTFADLVKVKEGDKQAIAKAKLYQKSKHAKTEASQARESLQAAKGYDQPVFAKASKVANPVASEVIKALSPSTSLMEAGKALKKGNVPAAALAASSVFPVGKGARLATGVERGIKAERAAAAGERAATIAKAGLTGDRALVVGNKAAKVTRARSRVTQNVIEKPADAASRAMPNAPVVGERARAIKATARAEVAQQGRARQPVVSAQKRVLPKANSDEDAAHFWWAHLPEGERNAAGLEKVKAGLQGELDRTLRKQPLMSAKKASKSLVAKRARVARLQKVYDKAVARSEKVIAEGKPAASAAIHSGSPTGTPLVTHVGAALSEAKTELATAEKRFALPRRPSKAAMAALPQQAQNLALHIAQLDRIIAKNPTANPKVFETLNHFEQEHLKALKSAGKLEGTDEEHRRGLVSAWLGLSGAGKNGEIYIGHRLGKVRGSGGIRSMGFGKGKNVEAAAGPNKLFRVRTGTVRASTHVAAEDLLAAHTYNDVARARHDLWEMGDPFPGHLPKGYHIVNPEGPVLPPHVKTDVFAGIGDKPHEVEAKARELLQGFLQKPTSEEALKQLTDEAKATGVYDKLRIISDKDAKRYYKYVLPAGPRGSVGKVYDKMIDMTAASLIFGRLGYIPKNMLQSMITIVPHQGVMFPLNAARTAQLMPRPGRSELQKEVWDFIVHEMGGGTSGSLEKEATSKFIEAPAHYATIIADSPGRVSAFIHEAAAHGVIPKLSFHLSDDDARAILALRESKNANKLHDIRQISADAMGDFNRMTPAQRRIARRAFIVPGWLLAGSRYPVHFAATHPGRSAALAYAAAGEPGAPKELQVNKPVTDYLQGGLPSYLQAVSAEHWPGFLGGGPGKSERVQSLLPGSIPFDAALAAQQGSPWSATGYVNPLPEMLWNTAHSTYETPSGETKKTTFRDALTGNLQRLAPSATLAQGLIAPGSVSSRLYPDHSRGALVAREFGVAPVKIDKQAAQRARFNQQGMTQSVKVLTDKQKLYDRIEAAGEKPSPILDHAFQLKLERSKALDGIHAHGLAYQQKAYKSDVALMLKHGLVTKEEAAATLKAAKSVDEDTLKKWRSWLGRNKFGGQTVSDVGSYLRQQGK